MTFECGIVGLPNVGKSTLFNTLTAAGVPAENFPFCTVDPHRGIVNVPDQRLKKIADIVQPERIVPAMVTFVDIAGLVKGAAGGEGLGNKFLSHIREVNAIAHVVRCFDDSNIVHVMGGVDPRRDMEIIELELCLADQESAQKRLEKAEKNSRSGDEEAKLEVTLMKEIIDGLGRGLPIRRMKNIVTQITQDQFLTSKPVLYVANIAESEVRQQSAQTKEWIAAVEAYAKLDDALVIPLSVALESQLREMADEDREVFQKEYGIEEPALDRFIREAYKALGLQTYFTAGVKEVRAWTIPQTCLAPDAAAAIHTDFKKGFIRAETIAYGDYIRLGGEKGAREKGVMRSEGKEYLVHDGDVILFRFAV